MTLQDFDTQDIPFPPLRGSDGWYGHLPCVCESHSGCLKHNPMDAPIYRNPLLPPQLDVQPGSSSSSQSRTQERIQEELPPYTVKPPEFSPVFIVKLPFHIQSAHTIMPSHPQQPYHLALYHLDCVRRQLNPRATKSLITELSCSGNFIHQGQEYAWSNEIFFDKGTFLQKQQVKYVMSEGSYLHRVTLICCPHHDLRLAKPVFQKKDGLTQVQLSWTTLARQDEYREATELGGEWCSVEGRCLNVEVCSVCYSDSEYTFEGVHGQFHMQFTSYRDLGPGNDPNNPKWLALVHGVGDPNREYSMALTARVQQVAETLERSNEVLGRTGGALEQAEEALVRASNRTFGRSDPVLELLRRQNEITRQSLEALQDRNVYTAGDISTSARTPRSSSSATIEASNAYIADATRALNSTNLSTLNQWSNYTFRATRTSARTSRRRSSSWVTVEDSDSN